jgi:hypothetical protein
METRPRDLLVAERVLEAGREIGILLIAFAPLDFAVGGAPIAESWPYLFGFLLVGFVGVSTCIVIEWRLKRWSDSS